MPLAQPPPRISIITINLNNSQGLEKTVKSLEKQTWRNFESIIIDGGSNDKSMSVIKEALHRKKLNIAFWTSEKDRGLYHAQNKGILASSGEYLLFLNSGDYLYDENTLQYLEPDRWVTDLVYGNIFFQYRHRRVKSQIPKEIKPEHLFYGSLMHPATFIKRQLFEIVGMYREDFRICSDYYFFTKAILAHNVSRSYRPEVVAVYPMDGISSSPKHMAIQDAERRTTQLEFFTKEMLIDIAKKGPPLPDTFRSALAVIPKYCIRKLRQIWNHLKKPE
jgi:glycosyltransferase involved in cell wall biosynthesis